jgi:CheY-like chemotaxis protein
MSAQILPRSAADWKAEPVCGSQARVLLAVGNDIKRIMISTMVERCGKQADAVLNGEQTIEEVQSAIASARPFGILLMDTQLPKLNGYSTAKMIRRSGIDAGHLPIIALTSAGRGDSDQSVRSAGMQGMLMQPLTMQTLSTTLEYWLPLKVSEAMFGQQDFSVVPFPRRELEQKWRRRRAEALRAVSAALRGSAFDGAELTDLARLVHQLAGTAGLLGEEQLGELAEELEAALRTGDAPEEIEIIARALLAAA